MDSKSFFIGMFVSYLIGIIVSAINALTEKALLIRAMRKKIREGGKKK